MTVAVGTELGGGSGLSAGSGIGAGSGLSAGTGIGAGTGLGAESAAGSAAGTGAGIASGTGFGRAFAAFENAGTNAGPGGSAAFAAGRGTSETWLNETAGSEAPSAGNESFKANWQPMLRAWGGPARAIKGTPEGAAGESGEPDTVNGSGGGQSAGSIGSALEFAGREVAQSPLAARGDGSTANGVVPAHNAPRANQMAAYGSKAAAAADRAAAWGATDATGSMKSSATGSKIAKRNGFAQNAGVEGQAAQKENGMLGSPADGSGLAAQVAPMPADIPHASAIYSAGQRRIEVRTDDLRTEDHMDGRAAVDEQPAPGPTAATNEVKGAVATSSASAATNSDVSARGTGQIPTHASQTPPTNRAMNAGGAAVKAPEQEQDDELEDIAALSQSTLTAAAMATASAPRAISVMETGTTSSAGEPKTTVAGLGAHRGFGEAGGKSTAQATALSGADKPGAETGIESQQTPLGKTAHDAAGERANAANSQEDGAHVVVAQNPGIESSAMARDPAIAHGAVSTPATIGSSTIGPATAPQETFAALDAGTTVGAPNWVHAGGRQAEAGFEDPALGWVGVRADLSGGSVHATLVPGSTDAAQALSGHLEGLSAYLSDQRSPVTTLTMAAPGNSGIGLAPDQSLAQGMGQGMEQSAGQQHGQQNQAPAFEMGSQPGVGASSLATGSAALANEFDAMAYARDGRGAHISVIA